MKRRGQPPAPLPARLRERAPSHVDEWRAAVLAWLEEDPARQVPWGVHGDALDAIRESAWVKREGTGRDE